MDEAARNADRVLVLAHGRLLHDGPAGEIDEDAFMALVAGSDA
jgi:ABC-type sugar transport system ATPase subunit